MRTLLVVLLAAVLTPPEEIYAAPRTDFVADFIGISNLFRARVVSAGAGVVAWEGRTIRVPASGLRDGADVLASVRPEKLAVIGDRVAPRDNQLEGVVEVITFLGPIVRLEVAVHGRPMWVDLPQAQAAGLTRRKPVSLTFAADDCVLIPATGSGPAGAAAASP
jgi:ABC-type Fe3+/spermidine/putrescine transport system ATPase subunit